MTTPTDAQISAALDALAPTSHSRADVKAALTAAAEGVDQKADRRPSDRKVAENAGGDCPGLPPTDAQKLWHIIYDVVKADVESEAEGKNSFQEGYAVGFNDARARILKALTAAAELGQPYATQLGDPSYDGSAAYEAYQKAIGYCDNATIESCAQVAESFSGRFFNHTNDAVDAIAAAIRALKDKEP